MEAQNESEPIAGLNARWFFGMLFVSLLALGVYGSWTQKRQGELALAAVKMAGFRGEQSAREATNLAVQAEKILVEGKSDAKVTALQIQSLQIQIADKLTAAEGELARAKEKGRVSPDVVAMELKKAEAAVLTARTAQKRIQVTAKEAGREATIAAIKHAPQEAVQREPREGLAKSLGG